ncbi:uncharacterized protein LOC121417233 [Lytechinus variegatus]|uniref:uncharacterized protein LOC121417233 n=1 Tax=Lytechinus variegatus TaxID=7654 RepID=UPI001BB13355|nr:uncharacterized protein LOC121417233 [Lytechinus variegatus]
MTSTNNSRQTLRQTDFLPSRFSGDKLDRDNSTAHFLTFDDYLDAHDIDKADPDQFQTILRTFRRTLQGQARLWIDGLQFNTYSDLKDGFIRRFSPAKSSYSHVTDFKNMTMTNNESADAYLQRLRTTAAYIDYGETQIRHKLLDSLPSDCRATILMTAPDLTSEEIAAKAQLFLDLNHRQTRPTKELSFSAQEEIDQLKEQIHYLNLKTDRDNDKRPKSPTQRPPTPRQRSASRSASRSVSSERRRDISNDRRDDRRNDMQNRRGRSPYRSDGRTNRPPTRRLTCNYCGIPGHIWRECRKRLRDMTTPPPPFPDYNDYYAPAYGSYANNQYYPPHQQQPQYHQPRYQQPQNQPRPQDF